MGSASSYRSKQASDAKTEIVDGRDGVALELGAEALYSPLHQPHQNPHKLGSTC